MKDSNVKIYATVGYDKVIPKNAYFNASLANIELTAGSFFKGTKTTRFSVDSHPLDPEYNYPTVIRFGRADVPNSFEAKTELQLKEYEIKDVIGGIITTYIPNQYNHEKITPVTLTELTIITKPELIHADVMRAAFKNESVTWKNFIVKYSRESDTIRYTATKELLNNFTVK